MQLWDWRAWRVIDTETMANASYRKTCLMKVSAGPRQPLRWCRGETAYDLASFTMKEKESLFHQLYKACLRAQSLSHSQLTDSMDCRLPGSSVHGILQARILEWVVISFSRGSSWPRDWTHVSCISCIGRRIIYHWATWEDHKTWGLPSTYIQHTYSCSHSHTGTSHSPFTLIFIPVFLSISPRMRTVLTFLTCNVRDKQTSAYLILGAETPRFPLAAPDDFPSRLSLASESSLAYHMHVLFICFFVLNKILAPLCGSNTRKEKQNPSTERKWILWELGEIDILCSFHLLVMSGPKNIPLRKKSHTH